MRKMSTWAMKVFSLVVAFEASYVLCQPSVCGKTEMSGASSGYLSSPRETDEFGPGGFSSSSPVSFWQLESYPSNTDCVYDIKTQSGTGIKFSWEKGQIRGYMPDCTHDYVEVFIGCDRTSVGRFCATNLFGTRHGRPMAIYSPDNCLRIKFHSGKKTSFKGDYTTYNGFWGKFTTFDMKSSKKPGGWSVTDTCTTSPYGKSNAGLYDGSISSPNWPQPYPVRYDGSSCYYKIPTDSSWHAKIVFMDFDLYKSSSCDKTKVKIKGGGSSYDKSSKTIMESKCGFKKPFTLIAKGGKSFLRFKPGSNSNNRGFIAGYVLYNPGGPPKDEESSSGFPIAVLIIIPMFVLIVIIAIIARRSMLRRTANAGAVSYQAAKYQQPPPAPGYAPQQPPPGPGYASPQQPPPGQGIAPPPSYDQVAGQQYQQPYPQQGPPPGSYPEKQGPYPPPQGYPPPGSQPYPAPGGQQYPPPGGQQYPPPGGQPPYPPAAGQPYQPPGGSSGSNQPYPT